MGTGFFPSPSQQTAPALEPCVPLPLSPLRGKAINVIGHEVIHPLLSYAYAKQALLLEWESPYREWVFNDFF